ncbi:hypothetical protein [Spirosoma migulaei]
MKSSSRLNTLKSFTRLLAFVYPWVMTISTRQEYGPDRPCANQEIVPRATGV